MRKNVKNLFMVTGADKRTGIITRNELVHIASRRLLKGRDVSDLPLSKQTIAAIKAHITMGTYEG